MPERRRIELSGALGRTQSRARGGLTAPRSLMRCRVGPYPLVIDLRDLTTLDTRNLAPEPPDLTLDLREEFGVPAEGPGRTLSVRRLTGERVRLTVDAGIELVSVDLTELQAFPTFLHRAPRLRCLCGVIPLSGELHYLLDPQPLIDHVLARGGDVEPEVGPSSAGTLGHG